MRDRFDRLKETLVRRAVSAYDDSMTRIASGEELLDIVEARRTFAITARASTRRRQAADSLHNYVPPSERPVSFR